MTCADRLLALYRKAKRIAADGRYSDAGRAAKVVELDDEMVDLCFVRWADESIPDDELIEQSVGLRLAERKLLKERQHLAGFVDRQPEAVNLIGQGHDDLDSEFAASERPRRFSKLVAVAEDLVGHQDGSPVLQPPSDAGVREFAEFLFDAERIDGLGAICQFDLVGGREPSASQRSLSAKSR